MGRGDESWGQGRSICQEQQLGIDPGGALLCLPAALPP